MMRIFLDTNFILDLLVRPEYKEVSRLFLSSADEMGCKCCVSYLSVANFVYITRKYPKATIHKMLQLIDHLFEIVPNDASQIKRAMQVNGDDFEDVLQYQAALSAECQMIITRNTKDFGFSTIPVLSPEMFLSRY